MPSDPDWVPDAWSPRPMPVSAADWELFRRLQEEQDDDESRAARARSGELQISNRMYTF